MKFEYFKLVFSFDLMTGLDAFKEKIHFKLMSLFVPLILYLIFQENGH